jgi:hypothetical protein
MRVPELRLGNHQSKVYASADASDRITNDAAQAFINDINDELRDGYGFVSLLGAGLSVPSGAPLIIEIKAYLERCIGLALGVEEPGMRAWNPRTDQWPPFVDRDRTQTSGWFVKVTEEFERKRGLDRYDVELPVFQEAMGAMAEWRSALLFLSRVVREKRGFGHGEFDVVALDAPDQDVIDGCLRELLRGRNPALTHRMLANLAGTLRLGIILSTNFDDLLERAFEEAGHALTVFDVHLHSTLPPFAALPPGKHSLIKIHGHRHSLRADYSLDSLPSEADKRIFLDYLVSSSSSTVQNRETGETLFRNHLIVMGSSATERRTRSFIEHAWDNLAADFKVYWLCHTKRDVAHVQTFTRDFWQSRDPKRSTGEKSRVLRYSQLGLLLLQLFQAISRSLPNSGMIFPSVSRLAIPPMASRRGDRDDLGVKRHIEEKQEEIRKRLLEFRRPGYAFHKLVAVTSLKNCRGLTSVCASIYEEMSEKGGNCLWFDMNDVSSADDLFEQMIDAAYYRLGTEHWMPVYIAKDTRSRAEEIRRVAQSKSGQWVLFLNARETPAANVSAYDKKRTEQYPNDWLDETRLNRDEEKSAFFTDQSRCQETFFELLTELCGPQSPAISVVLLCRQHATEPGLITGLRSNKMIDEPIILKHDCANYSEDRTVELAIIWTDNIKSSRRILHSLCLMQRVRLLATLWSEAVIADDTADGQSVIANDLLYTCIDELECLGLVKRKPGGFIWMHTRARNQLRHILEDKKAREQYYGEHIEVRPFLEDWKSELDEGKTHFLLAEWYRQVLSSSKSPAAIFECVYHLCRAAQAELKLSVDPEAVAFSANRLEEAASLLRSHSFLVQTHGYSRGSCRRLEFIRDSLCIDILDFLEPSLRSSKRNSSATVNLPIDRIQRAATWLRIRCTEVMRAIGREVGEDAIAFARQRELRALIMGVSLDQADSDRLSSKQLFKALFDSRHQLLFMSGGFVRSQEAPIEWVRWWKWNGMLGIASRSYSSANQSLSRGVLSASQMTGLTSDRRRLLKLKTDVRIETIEANVETIIEDYRQLRLAVCGLPVKNSERLAIELLRIIEQFVALRLLEWSLARRPDAENEPFDRSVPGDLSIVRRITRLGVRFADLIISRDNSQDAHYSIPAMLCKGHLLMHDGICAVHDSKWSDAITSLAKAESSLQYDEARRQGTDKAVLALHNVEVWLRQAGQTSIARQDNEEISFDKLCNVLSESASDDTLLWRVNGGEVRRRAYDWLTISTDRIGDSSSTLNAGLRRVRASLADALRSLSTAEQILVNRRRNVWWTTWFFQRKMQAIAMSVWASSFETKSPIPFLGLEFAPRKTPTEADILLVDSLRMIRVDAYRLATIIDEYRSVAVALHVRLLLDISSIRLPERQRRMHNDLTGAIVSLKKVLDARKNWAEISHRSNKSKRFGLSDRAKAKAELGTRMTDYIDGVMTRTEKVLSFLKNPFY